jgi:hypothetical protein
LFVFVEDDGVRRAFIVYFHNLLALSSIFFLVVIVDVGVGGGDSIV